MCRVGEDKFFWPKVKAKIGNHRDEKQKMFGEVKNQKTMT